MYLWQCKKCGNKPIQSASSPNSSGCSSGGFHDWKKLGEVGHMIYSCKKCGTQVETKSSPNSSGCPSDGFHDWIKLADNTPKPQKSAPPKSSSKTSSSSSSDNSKGTYALMAAVAVFAAIFIALKFVFFAGANLFNIATIFRYDLGTYGNNIKTAQQNSYIMLTEDQAIYNDIPQIKDLQNTNYILTIAPKGQILKNKGYTAKTGSSWVAVQFYQNDERKHGYLYVPYKMDYDVFKINSIAKVFTSETEETNYVKQKIDSIKEDNESSLIKELNNSGLNYIVIKDSSDLQGFEESSEYKNYKNIDKFANWGVYQLFMHKNDMNTFKDIHNKHTDPNLIITLNQ